MELTDPINIMKIIISLIEIAIEKTIYITKSENNELVFSLPLLLKVLKNDVYNFVTSDDIYSEAAQYMSEVTIDFEEENIKKEEKDTYKLLKDQEESSTYSKEDEVEGEWGEEGEGEWGEEGEGEWGEEEEEEEGEGEWGEEGEGEWGEEEEDEDGEEESQQYELTFDIPIYDIMDQIEENYNEDEMEKYGFVGKIIGEVNLIDNIWSEWIPDNHIGKTLKNMVDGFEIDWLK